MQPDKEEDGQGPVSRRFTYLADSDAEDLPDRLRHVISLLRAREKWVDWGRLLRDLLGWGRADRRVQRQWSRSFWGPAASREPTPADTRSETTP